MKIKNVIGYEGIYAVSDDGRVFSLKQGIEMKQHILQGYYVVNLKKDGKIVNARVHRMVYEAFKGRIIPNLVIDHRDGDKLNNSISNLRQITTRENTSYGWKGHKTTGLPTGVRLFKRDGTFGADISIKGERFFLGTFATADEASEAYQRALENWTKDGIKPMKRDHTMKLCKTCGQTKPVSEFYHINGHGYSWYCKECSRAYSKRKRDEAKQSKEG